MSAEPLATHASDVLVIGAGGAGLRAAIAASEEGCSVTVICKSLLGKAHTVMAEGGMAAALGNVAGRDNWEVHFADTMKGGKMLNNWRMARIHAREAPDRVLELERWGAVFDRTSEGFIHQRPFGAHTYPRLAHIGDRTGLELIRTLQDRAVHQEGLTVHMETTVGALLKAGGRVAGALAYRRSDGGLALYRAGAVILATGGGGRIYSVTSNSWECTGDGSSLAYEAGAHLRDCEMVQFHPAGMVWPAGVRGILVTEGVRGEGGILLNSEGERFMERYDSERMELSSRDIVARAINSEVLAGRGSPHGGAFLDISHKPAALIRSKLPSMYEQFLKLARVDITREPMEVAPTIHYFMGGLVVDAETGASSLPGLFAAGEVAGGLHGANRLGGNSLTDLLVFGRRTGEAAAADAAAVPRGTTLEGVGEAVEALLAPLTRPLGPNPYALQQELQEICARHAPIIRDRSGLEEGLGKVEELAMRAAGVGTGGPIGRAFNPGWHTALDLRHMLVNAEALFRSALAREESRGAHSRGDFPETRPELERVTFMTSRAGDRMRVEAVAAEPIPEHLLETIHQKFPRFAPEETE